MHQIPLFMSDFTIQRIFKETSIIQWLPGFWQGSCQGVSSEDNARLSMEQDRPIGF